MKKKQNKKRYVERPTFTGLEIMKDIKIQTRSYYPVFWDDVEKVIETIAKLKIY